MRLGVQHAQVPSLCWPSPMVRHVSDAPKTSAPRISTGSRTPRARGRQSEPTTSSSADQRQIKPEDPRPAPGGRDQRAPDRAKHAARLRHRANQPQRQPAPRATEEVARDGHRHRHERAAANRLNEARRHQNIESWR